MTLHPKRVWLALALIVALVPLLRLRSLVNADLLLNADEAVDGLVMRHLVQRHELALFNWDTTYYGITEGLIALPFALTIGFTPLALKLSALVGCLLCSIAIFLLARRLYGPAAGLLAAALSVAISPMLLYLGSLASGGYFLVVALGTFTLLLVDRCQSRAPALGMLALGLLAGFGLYTYQLFVPYLLLVLLWAASRALMPGAAARPVVAGWLSLLAGIGIGWAPYLVHLATAGQGGKQPSYALAGATGLMGNWRLLTRECVPHFFGLRSFAGEPISTFEILCASLIAAGFAASWLWALLRGGSRRASLLRPASTETLLVLLVPLVAGLFLVSRNPKDALSVRYLLPWLTSFPVLAGGALSELSRRRGRYAAIALATVAIAFPVARSFEADLSNVVGQASATPEMLRNVIRFAESRGLRGAYGPYWIAYKTTFLSGERLIVSSYQDWDRYPPYRALVDRLPEIAVIVQASEENLDPVVAGFLRRYRADIRNRLETSGRPFAVRGFDPYEVYYSPTHERLLGPEIVTPVALARPQAEIEATAPAQAPPATRLTIRARIVNRSDAGWSATGLPFRAGALRVTLAYRWLRPDGTAAVVEGERSLLPADVEPGAALAVTPHVVTPSEPGRYQLVLTLVQEEVAWFDQASGSAWRAWMDVSPPTTAPRL